MMIRESCASRPPAKVSASKHLVAFVISRGAVDCFSVKLSPSTRDGETSVRKKTLFSSRAVSPDESLIQSRKKIQAEEKTRRFSARENFAGTLD